MPSLLRRRIHCFYCGTRSAHSKDEGINKFTCSSCEATNYLDQNGDITDVPTTPQASAIKTYAKPRQSSSPPVNIPASSSSLFCALCLKNQHFLTECLANYLPAESDPQYAKFEAEFPEYKKRLERRYPPVCPKCEPKVRERLKKSTYAAKSDILTKRLAQPSHGSATASTSWWSPLVYLAESAWWASLLVQTAWHFLGVLGMLHYGNGYEAHDTNDPTGMVTLSCLAKSARLGTLLAPCSPLLAQKVFQSLLCALAVFWWNPSLNKTWRNRSVGKGDFYRLQIILLVVRTCSWISLKDGKADSDQGAPKAGHAFMLAFLFFATWISCKIVAPTPQPKISFRDSDVPLVDKESFQYPSDGMTSQSSAHLQASNILHRAPPKAFPISSLAPRASQNLSAISSESSAMHPPTPPESEFGMSESGNGQMLDDSMDWEPIRSQPSPSQNIRPRYNPNVPSPQAQGLSSAMSAFGINPEAATPSPFYGQLPMAPKSMNHRLRNAANNPVPQFHPTPTNKQQDWFQKMRLANSSWATKDYVQSMPDPDRRTMDLADPKWTLKSDLDAANRGTGLEDIFTSSFNLGDEADAASHTAYDTRPNAPVQEVREPQPVDANALIKRLLTVLLFPTLLGAAAGLVGVIRDPDTTGGLGAIARPWVERTMAYAYGHA